MSESKPAPSRGLIPLIVAAFVLAAVGVPATLAWKKSEPTDEWFVRVRKQITVRHEGIGGKLASFVLGKTTGDTAQSLLGAPDHRETVDGLDLWTYDELRQEDRKKYILGLIQKGEGRSRQSTFHLLAFRDGVLVHLVPKGSLDAEVEQKMNGIRSSFVPRPAEPPPSR